MGNWEPSFNKLPWLLQTMQTYLLEFVYKLKTRAIIDERRGYYKKNNFFYG